MKFSHRQKCFCAFCKTQRSIYTKKRVGLFDIFGSILGAGICSMAIWQSLDPRGILIFVAMLAMAEAFIQIRWRLNIVCNECGFDPILYVKDSKKAAEKVKLHLEKRKEDPASLFKAPLDLPKISKEKADKMQNLGSQSDQKSLSARTGRIISKQI